MKIELSIEVDEQLELAAVKWQTDADPFELVTLVVGALHTYAAGKILKDLREENAFGNGEILQDLADLNARLVLHHEVSHITARRPEPTE